MPDTELPMTLFFARWFELIFSVSKRQPDFQNWMDNVQTNLLLFIGNLETALSEMQLLMTLSLCDTSLLLYSQHAV